MIQLAILGGLVAMIAATRFSPTSEELRASFADAQKFYSSGAYDQAIESYGRIGDSDSRFLDADAVLVTVGDISAPLLEVARYQTGNAHFKMAEEELRRAARRGGVVERAGHLDRASRLFAQAAEFFVATEATSSVTALQALARSQAVTCWYKMKEYQRSIDGARRLIEAYPESKYVVNAMYDIGWAYYDMEQYGDSIEAFEQLVARFSTGYRVNRALFQLGEAYFRLERYADAIPRYQRLVDSQRIGQMSEREILLMKREKIAGLVDETALELAAKALLRIGVCYARLGEHDRAAEAFETVATQFGGEPRLAEDAYLRHADMHFDRGDLKACIEVYRRAIEARQDAFGKARMQLLLANRYFEIERYEDAVREYDRYRDLYEMRAAQAGLAVEGVGLQIARAWFREAERHPEEERLDYHRRAEAELRQTLTAYPGSTFDIELRFNLALALQLQDDGAKLDEALDLFTSVSEAGDSAGYRKSALFQIARLHHRREEYGGGAAVYELVIGEFSDDAEADIARFELGVVLKEAGEWAAAAERFTEVRPEAALYARSRQEAGQILLQNGEPARAVQVLEAGRRSADPQDGPSLALFRYLLGACHASLGDHAAALPHFDAAVAGAAFDLEQRAAYGRGVTLFKMGRIAEAVRDLERDWTDPELRASAPRLLATAYTSLGRFGEALDLYGELAAQTETALETAELYLAQAEISFREGRYGEVVAACARIEELDFKEEGLPPERPYFVAEKALFLLADASIQLQDAATGRAAAAGGQERFPGGFYAPEFLFLGGLAALQLDRQDEAVRRLTQLLEDFPGRDDGYTRYYLGFAYYNQSRFDEAAGHFAQTAERFPRLDVAVDALFRAGECRFNLKQYELARRTYQAVIDRYPTSTVAENALYNIAWCLTSAASGGQGSEETARAFSAYAERYPRGRHLPAVRYTLAEMSFNAGDYRLAYGQFRAIQEEYPGSAEAAEAAAVLPQLLEAIAFQEYSAAMEQFNLAVGEEDEAKLRGSIIPLEEVWKRYPDTPGGVAAKVNVGVCLQRLEEWEQAVAVFEEIIAEGEMGNAQVTPEVSEFAQRRRDSIARKHL